MAAKIYASPEEIGDPPAIDFSNRDIDWDEVLAPEREWEESLKQWCRDHGQGSLRGEEWRYPMADGYARYVVFSERPLKLIHVPTGDAWSIDEVVRRGLTAAYLRKNIASRKKVAELFGSKA